MASASTSTCSLSCSFAAVTCKASRCPKVSTAACTFEPRLRLAPSYPERLPCSGVERSVRLSRIAAVGSLYPALCQAQQSSEVVHHRFESPSGKSSLSLLVYGFPGREVVRQHPPGRSTPHDPPQPVKDLAQIVGALRGIFSDKCQIRGDKSPLLVGNVAWVRFTGFHACMLPPSKAEVHNTL